jgi:hypothetical protein
MTVAVLNIVLPASRSAIVVFAASPAGYGQAHFVVVQHMVDESQLALPPPVPGLPEKPVAPPPGTPVAPAPGTLVAPAPGTLVAPAPGVCVRSLLPLPPQADPKAAAPASSTATAQKPDFEEYRMGSTDHPAEHSSQCAEWILTFI